MLFFDCEDPCLLAYMGMCPKRNPARNWVHTEIWALGEVLWMWWSTAWGWCVSGHRTCHVYSGWDLAVLMFTVSNNIACSKIQGFVLPASFLRTQGCLFGWIVPTTYIPVAVMTIFKVIGKERDRYSSLEVIWNKANSPAPHWGERGGGCLPACLCFVRQVRIHVWLAAALGQELGIRERRQLDWETLLLNVIWSCGVVTPGTILQRKVCM